jgi:hypothetical protein
MASTCNDEQAHRLQGSQAQSGKGRFYHPHAAKRLAKRPKTGATGRNPRVFCTQPNVRSVQRSELIYKLSKLCIGALCPWELCYHARFRYHHYGGPGQICSDPQPQMPGSGSTKRKASSRNPSLFVPDARTDVKLNRTDRVRAGTGDTSSVKRHCALLTTTGPSVFSLTTKSWSRNSMPCCTIPIVAECSFVLDSHHPIISLQGIPGSIIVFRILHPILASTLCDANPLARIAGPKMIL